MSEFFQPLLSPSWEYITCDRQLQITGWSKDAFMLALNPDPDDNFSIYRGQDIRDPLPELIGLEETIENIFIGTESAFELMGVQRDGQFWDLLMVCEPQNTSDTDHKHLLVLIRNSSDRMNLEQRLGQVAKDCSLVVQELSIAQNYLNQIVTAMSDALFVTDQAGTIQRVNTATTHLLGYTEAELLNQPIQKLFTSLALQAAKNFPKALIGDDLEQPCQTANDQTITLSFSCSTLTNPNTQQLEYVCIGRDISLRKQLETELHAKVRADRLLTHLDRQIRQTINTAELLETTASLLFQWFACDRIIIVRYTLGHEAKIATLIDYTDYQTLNQGQRLSYSSVENSVQELKQQLHTEDVQSDLALPFFEAQELWGILVIHYCHRQYDWSSQEVHLLERVVAQVSLALSQARLYEQLERANKELEKLAHIDSLTQLANRRLFFERLQQEHKLAQQFQQPLSLILCDVDFFKTYNDYYGHPQGDYCLQMIGQILRSICQNTHFLAARYGGEEFILLMPNTNAQQLEQVAATVHQALHSRALIHERSPLNHQVTLSLGGITFIPQAHNWQPRDLVKLADQALYCAKQEGRNCSRFWPLSS